MLFFYFPNPAQLFIAKGRGHRAEGRREKIEGLRFQYLARVLIALATAISLFCHSPEIKIKK